MEKSPSKGADDSLVSIIFLHNNQYPVHLPISSSFSLQPTNNSYPHSKAKATYVDRCKIGQGQHRVMIYIYIVVLKPLMLHAKFC